MFFVVHNYNCLIFLCNVEQIHFALSNFVLVRVLKVSFKASIFFIFMPADVSSKDSFFFNSLLDENKLNRLFSQRRCSTVDITKFVDL